LVIIALDTIDFVGYADSMTANTSIRCALLSDQGRAVLAAMPPPGSFLSRTAFAREVRARFGFVDALGNPRESSCKAALRDLDAAGIEGPWIVGVRGSFASSTCSSATSIFAARPSRPLAPPTPKQAGGGVRSRFGNKGAVTEEHRLNLETDELISFAGMDASARPVAAAAFGVAAIGKQARYGERLGGGAEFPTLDALVRHLELADRFPLFVEQRRGQTESGVAHDEFDQPNAAAPCSRRVQERLAKRHLAPVASSGDEEAEDEQSDPLAVQYLAAQWPPGESLRLQRLDSQIHASP